MKNKQDRFSVIYPKKKKERINEIIWECYYPGFWVSECGWMACTRRGTKFWVGRNFWDPHISVHGATLSQVAYVLVKRNKDKS